MPYGPSDALWYAEHWHWNLKIQFAKTFLTKCRTNETFLNINNLVFAFFIVNSIMWSWFNVLKIIATIGYASSDFYDMDIGLL